MADGDKGLIVRTLGPMQIERDGLAIPVPASRKARAILGYLILAPRAVGRQRLCDLFFDIPDDPRASLRWTLTKLRAAIDAEGEQHIVSSGDSLRFDPAAARIDVLDILHGAADQPLPDGDGLFLEDCELPDRQEFSIWLQTVREDIRRASIQRLRGLIDKAPLDRRLPLYRKLLLSEPLDEAASAGLAQTLAQLGRMSDAREAVANAERTLTRAGIKPGSALRSALKAPETRAPEPAAAAHRVAAPTTVFDQLPSVAILPFHNYSPDLIPDDLMEGFLESTIHMLSRFRSFRVSALGAVLAFKGKMQDPLEIGAATGARYIVGGSVMIRGKDLKIRYRVVDGETGALVSNGDADIVADALAPGMLEDAPARLVVYLMHQVYELALKKSYETPEESRSAVDYFHCAIIKGFTRTPANIPLTLKYCEKALELQPAYANAMVGIAWCKALLGQTVAEPGRSEALALARKGIVAGNDDAMALSGAAWTLMLIDGDVDAAVRTVDLALKVNPLARMAWDMSAKIRSMRGEYDVPMQHWDHAERCSPLNATADQINSGRALCCWIAGRYAEAATYAKLALDRAPGNPTALGVSVAAPVMLGDVEAARSAGQRVLAQEPQGASSIAFTGIPILMPEVRQSFLDAIAKGLAS